MRRGILILALAAAAGSAGLITEITIPKVARSISVSANSVSWPLGPSTAAVHR